MATISNSELINHFITTFELKHRGVHGSKTQLQIEQILDEREKQIIGLENQILNRTLKTEGNILQISSEGVYTSLPNSEKKIPRYSPYKEYEPLMIDLILLFKVDSDKMKNKLLKFNKWQYVELVGIIQSLHKHPTHYDFEEKDKFGGFISVTLELISIETMSDPKSEGCFIASAVYGDYNSSEVLILRNFRDKYLKMNFFGRQFINIYYNISPKIAEYITKSIGWKAPIRIILLTPIVKIIKLFMETRK
jgi:hypothetical protein